MTRWQTVSPTKIPITVVNASDAPSIGLGDTDATTGEHLSLDIDAWIRYNLWRQICAALIFITIFVFILGTTLPGHLVGPVKLLKAFRASAKVVFHCRPILSLVREFSISTLLHSANTQIFKYINTQIQKSLVPKLKIFSVFLMPNLQILCHGSFPANWFSNWLFQQGWCSKAPNILQALSGYCRCCCFSNWLRKHGKAGLSWSSVIFPSIHHLFLFLLLRCIVRPFVMVSVLNRIVVLPLTICETICRISDIVWIFWPAQHFLHRWVTSVTFANICISIALVQTNVCDTLQWKIAAYIYIFSQW